jgi:hypothetical protein
VTHSHWTQAEIDERERRAEEYLQKKHAEYSVGLSLLWQFGIIAVAIFIAAIFALRS